MEITVEKKGEVQLVTIVGSLDTFGASEFEEGLRLLNLSSGSPDIVLEMTGVQHASSPGLRVINGLYNNTKGTGIKIIVRNAIPRVREKFLLSGFEMFLTIE